MTLTSLTTKTGRLVQKMAMLSDGGSRVNYLRLRSGKRSQPGVAPLGMRVRMIGGQQVYCRPATTDLNVFNDTFCGAYHLPPRDLRVRTILDLGSNIGLTIAHYAHLYPDANILGVELDKTNAALCRMNIEPYGSRCELLVGAAWKVDGQIEYAGDSEWGYSVTQAGDGKHKVRAYSIPTLIDRLGVQRVDFLKMDIEGAELDVLAGAEKWAGRVACMKVEIHAPYTVAACVHDLERAGMICEVAEEHFGCVLGRLPGV